MESYLNGRRISPDDILDSREKRSVRQEELLSIYQDKAVLSVTMNIPGDIKAWERLESLFDSYTADLRAALEGKIVFEEVNHPATGPEGLFVVDSDASSLKKMVCSFEEKDDIGRLFDLDVMTGEGKVSRQDLGYPPRKCFMCEKEAFLCRREGNHDIESIIAHIIELMEKSLGD